MRTRRIRDALLFVWQLPQNVIGFIAVHALGAERQGDGTWAHGKRGLSSASLGNYIIMRMPCADREFTVMHERGHQRQSLYLGWLYLPIIGLPSAAGNVLHRAFCFDYYAQPWERWANRLGGIE